MTEMGAANEVFGNLAFELRDGLQLARRLIAAHEEGGLDERERELARRHARRLAAEGRIGFLRMAELNATAGDHMPGYLAALRVGTRLSYCLHALAGDEPEPLALLPRASLDSLPRDEGAEEWLDLILSLLPEGASR